MFAGLGPRRIVTHSGMHAVSLFWVQTMGLYHANDVALSKGFVALAVALFVVAFAGCGPLAFAPLCCIPVLQRFNKQINNKR